MVRRSPGACRSILPGSWLRRFSQRPSPGDVAFGALRRTTPISRSFGFDRGTPIDRHYIEQFLQANTAAVQGRVLEIGGNEYTRRVGTGVTHGDVLHIEPGHGATIVGDLTDGAGLAPDIFDCIICTQTLQHIYLVQEAIATLHRALKPGGVLLMTVPGISQISRFDMDRWGDYWRFTTLSARRLCEECFPPANVSIEAHGSVLTAVAFLHGLAAEDLRPEELRDHDADYELVITAKAVK